MPDIPFNPIGAEIEKATGLKYDGIWEGVGLQFTDVQQTGSTIIANSLQEAKDKLAIMRAKFFVGEIESGAAQLIKSKEEFDGQIR